MNTVQVFRAKTSRYPGGYKPWYVRLVSANGEPLAVSEAYMTKWNAKRAARKNFPDAKLVIVTEDFS